MHCVKASTMTPVKLKCEYTANPLGIDELSPRLSWELLSAERGDHQTAYRILVATTPELLRMETGDLWDSGKVESGQSIHVVYAGSPLQSGMRCYWTVRAWDKDGAAGPYSDVGFWEMGLLADEEWEARWIGAPKLPIPDGKTSGPSPIFRRAFALDQAAVSARVYICGLGYYELYLNGLKVGDHVLDPVPTRFDRRALYVTYDVTEMLNSGQNAVGVILGSSLYNCHTVDDWNVHAAPWRDLPKLMLHMDVELADGSHRVITSDGDWKASTGPFVFEGLRNGETYDARLEKPGWSNPDYDDSDWLSAEVVPGPGGVLSAQSMPPCKVVESLKPVSISEVGPGVFVCDMGQSISGWIQLTVSGSAGTEVTLRYGEKLAANGEVDQRNIGLHVKSGDIQTDRYILKGTGIEVWEPRFTYHGFRYVQLTGFPGVPTADNILGRVVHTAFDSAGEFACSNELLNAIQECTRWSYRGNFVGIPTDCPHREKNGWTGDAHLAAETGLFNFTPQAAYTKWMTDFADEQRLSGQLPGIIPTGGWGYNWGSGPAWDSAYTHIPMYLYLYSGDLRILETHYAGMKRYVDFMTSMSTGDLLSFGLGDWCPPKLCDAVSPTALTSTAYYYANCRILARIAGLLGEERDIEYYSALAERIKAAFNAEFYDPASGRYAEGGQTSQSCALFYGLVEPEEKEKVLARLVASIIENENHPSFGILGAKYALNILTDEGYADIAYDIITQTTYPGWGHWIEQGATTLWETWEGNSSLNHIMFGDVSAWMFKTLAGISPDISEPGFRRVVIHPRIVGDLTWVKAEHTSMYGRIRSSWRMEGDLCLIDIEVPVNTTARVYLMTKDLGAVRECGQSIREAEGVTGIGEDNGYVVLDAGSGEYHISVQLNS